MAKILALERNKRVDEIAFAPDIVAFYEVLFGTEVTDTVDVIKEVKKFFVGKNLKYKSFTIRKKDSEADFPLYYSFSTIEEGAGAVASMEYGDRAAIRYRNVGSIIITKSSDMKYNYFNSIFDDEKTSDEFYKFVDALGNN